MTQELPPSSNGLVNSLSEPDLDDLKHLDSDFVSNSELLSRIISNTRNSKMKTHSLVPGESFKGQFPLMLSPMATVTRYPFRSLCHDLGSELSISELISAHSLVIDRRQGKKNQKLAALLETHADERPVGLQLFDGDPDYLADAARIVEKEGAFQFVDLNAGCPKKKVTRKGAGAALLRQPLSHLEDAINALTSATALPVSLKIRLGWTQSSETAPEIVRLAERYGLWYVAVHGRFASDSYADPVNMRKMQELAARSEIPIVGNGDAYRCKDLENYRSHGLDGVMIGRGAAANPFLFSRVDDPKRSDLWAAIQYVLRISRRSKHHRLDFVRRILRYMASGFEGARELRARLNRAVFDDDQLDTILNELVSFT